MKSIHLTIFRMKRSHFLEQVHAIFHQCSFSGSWEGPNWGDASGKKPTTYPNIPPPVNVKRSNKYYVHNPSLCTCWDSSTLNPNNLKPPKWFGTKIVLPETARYRIYTTTMVDIRFKLIQGQLMAESHGRKHHQTKTSEFSCYFDWPFSRWWTFF